MAGGRSVSVTPYASVSETFTDNANLSPDGQWDAITRATLGLSMTGTYRSLTGRLSLGLTGLYSARGKVDNRLDNASTLNAAGTLALVDDRVFLDGYARVSQRLVDPFGVSPSEPQRPTGDTTTTFDYGLSPWARGTIGGSVNYYARLNVSGSTNAESSAYGARDLAALVRLDGGTGFRRLGWALTAVGRSSAYGSAAVRTGNYGGTASLIYAVTPYFSVRANAGVEYRNYADADVTQRSRLYGAGVDWQPTDRTSITGFYENRFFGDAYFASVQHRTAKTVWTYRGRQGISEVGGVTPVSLGTNYDLFFQQFASIEPDPVKRDQLVREFLLRNGIPLEQQVVAGFLTRRIQLQRSHDFSFAWRLSRRDTLILSIGQGDTSALVEFLGAGDTFDNDSVVRSRRFSAALSHQLTPRSSISVIGGRTKTADRDGARSTTQDTFVANWGTTTGRRSRVDVAVRHTTFNSPTRPYDENALTATLNIRF